MSDVKPYPCTNCGLCCNSRNYPPGGVELLHSAGFPHQFDSKTGFCEKYDQEKKGCSIYADRPLACRVLETKPPSYSTDRWYGENARLCNQMIRKAGLPDPFLVVEVLDERPK